MSGEFHRSSNFRLRWPSKDEGATQQMTELPLPETRYALSGDVSIAYQVMGEGPLDLVLVPGVISHVEAFHEPPGYTASCAASLASPGLSPSTSAARVFRIAWSRPPGSRRAWTMSGR